MKILLLLLLIPSLAFGGLTDEGVYPRPASPPTFDSNHKTVDPTFGSTLMRLSGPVGSNAVYESDTMTRHLAPIQHFHSPWSMSGNHFIVWETNLPTNTISQIALYEIDRTAFTVTRVKAITAVYNMNMNVGTHFSHTNEWIIYAADTSSTPHRIRRWNVSDSVQDGLAANSSEVIYTDSDGIYQLTQSDSDDRFCWETVSTPKVVKVWEKSTNSLYTYNAGSLMYSFDESQISRDGSWVSLKGHPTFGDDISRFMDYTFTTTYDYHSYTNDRMSGKQSAFGGRWVNETTQYTTYRLATRNMPTDAPGTLPRHIFIHPDSIVEGVHPSMSIAGYIFGGFYKGSAGLPSPWKSYYDEIVRIEDQDAIANGNKVLRLAHAWSNFYSNSYDEIPTFSSPSGDYVLFYSNWNASDNAGRRDTFIVATGEVAASSPTCSDRIRNGTETGVDCGGTCAACVVVPAGSAAYRASGRFSFK